MSTVSSHPPLSSLMEYSSPISPTSPVFPTPATPQVPAWNSPADVTPRNDVIGFDTQTPIVVQPDCPPSQSPSDRTSAGRDDVLPGEELLYDGAVKSSQSLGGPFEDAHLKVFRNTISNDLRLHSRIGTHSETYWMKGDKSQLVPMYAYDLRAHQLVFIRESGAANGYGSGPSSICQFEQLQDLLKFQSRLTGEDVVLDISSVKWVKLAKLSNPSSKEFYSSVRVQIWHEPRSRKTMQPDAASFTTRGTTLSGPIRDRTVPNSSRLLVFLGRAEEYITCYITDDIEIDEKNQTCVKLKPRKYAGFHRRTSRSGVRAHLEARKSSEPAGLDIHGELHNPDAEEYFDSYKTFEIQFENSPSQVNFVLAWNEVMTERRRQRVRLAKIQEEMQKKTFTATDALAIRT